MGKSVRTRGPSAWWGVVAFWICLNVFFSVTSAAYSDHQTETNKQRNGLHDEDPYDFGRNRTTRDVNRRVIVTTILQPPYMMLKEQAMGSFLTGNDRFEGYMADALSHLSVSIGFDYVIKLSLDRSHGNIGPDGNWNGMIGELQRGEADMAVGPITVTADRAAVVDFTEPFMAFRTTALIKKQPRSHGDNQGTTRQRIMTVEDLLQSDIIYGVRSGGITEQLIRSEDDPLYRSMWSRMVNFWPVAFVRSTEEGVERTRMENYAFVLDAPMAEYKLGQQPCDLDTIEPFLSRRHYAIAMRKGDRLKDVINAEIRNMRRNQILQSLYLKWWASTCNAHQSPYDNGERDTWELANPGSATSQRPGRGQSTSPYRSDSCSIHHGRRVWFQWTGFTLALLYVTVCRFVCKNLAHCL